MSGSDGANHVAATLSFYGAHVLVTGAGVTGPPVAKALLAAGAVVKVTDADDERIR